MPLPSFTVTGNLYDVLGNITGTDLVVTPTSAKVIFTPNIKGGWVKWDGDNHRILPVEAEITADGVKRDGDPVTLLANDPSLSVENIQWEVLVRLNTVPGVAVPRASVPKPFPIEAPNDGGTVDLGAVAPVAWTAATPIIKGDKGDQGFSFAGLEPTEDLTAVQPLRESDSGPVPIGDPVDLSPILQATYKQLARTPDVLIAGTVTRDANGAATSAPVVWPDGTVGTYTADTLSTAFPGAVDAYHITYGSPVTKTYTQPAITRNAEGAATAVPQIVVT